jgi:hypothetical protein
MKNNNDNINNNAASTNISRSSTKTKCAHSVKRKQIKNKRSSKRRHSFCIIV